MHRYLQYLLVSLTLLTLSCSEEKEEIIPEIDSVKPKILNLNPTVGVPGDTIVITLENPDQIEIKEVLVNDLDTYFEVLSSDEVLAVIPESLSRSETVIIQIDFQDYTLNSAGFIMTGVAFESINLDTITLGDTLVITGEYFANDIDEVLIGKSENFNKENDYLLRSIEIIEIENNQIKAYLNSTYSLENFQNYKIGLRVEDDYFFMNEDLHLTLKVRKASRFHPDSEAPGSLLLFDVFNGGANDLEIVINQDTIRDPLWTWSHDGFQRANFETPYDLIPGVQYSYRAFKSGNELKVLNNSILIEEPTYTFSSDSFDKTQANDITFILSHVYIGYAYIIRLISQVDGQVAYEWSGSQQIDENVLGDGNGVELTVTAGSYTLDGSYYVQILAGLESYELSPAGNNVITFE